MKKRIMIAVIMQFIPGIADCMNVPAGIADCMTVRDDGWVYYLGKGGGFCEPRQEHARTREMLTPDGANRKKRQGAADPLRGLVCLCGFRVPVRYAHSKLGAACWIASQVEHLNGGDWRAGQDISAGETGTALAFGDGSLAQEFGKNFQLNSTIASLLVPPGVRTLGESSLGWCNKLEYFAFMNGSVLTKLDHMAFFACSKLPYLKVPYTVQVIGNQCFACCISLRRVDFEPNSRVKELGALCFDHCSALETAQLPNSLKSVPAGCFADCTNLDSTDYNLGPTTEIIGAGAFTNCTGLTIVTIPGAVQTIERRCFDGCTHLRCVLFKPGTEIREIDYSAIPTTAEIEGLPVEAWSRIQGIAWRRPPESETTRSAK